MTDFTAEAEQIAASILSGDPVSLNDLNTETLKLISDPKALAEIAAELLEDGQEITSKIEIPPLTITPDRNLILDTLGLNKEQYAHVLISKNGKIALNNTPVSPTPNNNTEIKNDTEVPNNTPDIIKYTYPEAIDAYNEIYPMLEENYEKLIETLEGDSSDIDKQTALNLFLTNIDYLSYDLSEDAKHLNADTITPEEAIKIFFEQLQKENGGSYTLEELKQKLDETNKRVLSSPQNQSNNIDEYARDKMYAAAFKAPEGDLTHSFTKAHNHEQQPDNEPTQAPNLTQNQVAFALT